MLSGRERRSKHEAGGQESSTQTHMGFQNLALQLEAE